MQTTLATKFGRLDNVELLKGGGIPYLNGGAVGKFDCLFTSAPDVHVGMAVSHWVHEGGTSLRGWLSCFGSITNPQTARSLSRRARAAVACASVGRDAGLSQSWDRNSVVAICDTLLCASEGWPFSVVRTIASVPICCTVGFGWLHRSDLSRSITWVGSASVGCAVVCPRSVAQLGRVVDLG